MPVMIELPDTARVVNECLRGGKLSCILRTVRTRCYNTNRELTWSSHKPPAPRYVGMPASYFRWCKSCKWLTVRCNAPDAADNPAPARIMIFLEDASTSLNDFISDGECMPVININQ